ncbi:hypothetical protein LJC20_04885 [Eubacteriales bacterium OttesenSCG-928-M02]|nr:hypothetical protein [Eubacteriales bacterium OttesenSCG-928-M02]
MMMDFDALFRQYLLAHMGNVEEKSEEELDDLAGELYHAFVHTPLPELDGNSMEEYFTQMGTAALVEELFAYARSDMAAPEFLVAVLLERAETEALLTEALEDADVSPAEKAKAIPLLIVLESHLPMETYLGLVTMEDTDTQLANLCAVALVELGDPLAGVRAVDALPQMEGEEGRMRLADLASHFSAPGAFDAILPLFEGTPCAAYAQFLARLGDERAVDSIKQAMMHPQVGYLDYIAMRDAVESLGEEIDLDREFSGDTDFEYLKTRVEE